MGLHLPADVDHQAGVRRVRPIHCPPKVLLSTNFIVLFFFIYKIFENLGKCLSTNISIWFSMKTSLAINTITWLFCYYCLGFILLSLSLFNFKNWNLFSTNSILF